MNTRRAKATPELKEAFQRVFLECMRRYTHSRIGTTKEVIYKYEGLSKAQKNEFWDYFTVYTNGDRRYQQTFFNRVLKPDIFRKWPEQIVEETRKAIIDRIAKKINAGQGVDALAVTDAVLKEKSLEEFADINFLNFREFRERLRRIALYQAQLIRKQ